jgi:4-hydroxybenzoate polyprenyltransferase
VKVFDFIFAARPMLLLPVWSVYLVSLHYHNELSGGGFSVVDLLVLVGLSLIFSGAYYLNQVTDYESDRINNKLGFLQKGILTERELMAGYLIVSLVGVGLGLLISTVTVFLFLAVFVLGYLYSASPWRLKDRAVLGLIANAVAYGLLVSMSVMPEMTFDNIGLLGWDNPFYFLATVGSIYCVTTVPDREGDKAVGKQTLAVWVGPRVTLAIGFVLMVGATVIAMRSGFALLMYLAGYSAIVVLIAVLVPYGRLLPMAAKIPLLLLTVLAGVFYPVYLVFIVALVVGTRIYYRRRFNRAYPELA